MVTDSPDPEQNEAPARPVIHAGETAAALWHELGALFRAANDCQRLKAALAAAAKTDEAWAKLRVKVLEDGEVPVEPAGP